MNRDYFPSLHRNEALMIRQVIAWFRHPETPALDPDAFDRLRANEAQEDTLARSLRGPGGPETAEECAAAVNEILTLREARVLILKELRWDLSAEALAEDTAMRRAWTLTETRP